MTPKGLYVVYYGSFTATQHAILDIFLQKVGGSGVFNVNTELYLGSRQSTIENSYSPPFAQTGRKGGPPAQNRTKE